MNYQKIINDISSFSIDNENEFEEYINNILNSLQSKNELIQILKETREENSNKLKNYIIENSEKIISIFVLIRKLKDELFLSKNHFDAMSNQSLIIKKKYIEPFEKLSKAISNKTNIDEVINLYEEARNFKSDFKIIKSHFDKDTLTLSEKNFEIFIRLRKYSLADLAGINYISEEYIWFQKNGENLLDKFREKFEECVGHKNNNEILKFFEFFSKLNILVNEIKNITNKSLKELMIEKFLNTIIKEVINTINPLDLIYENIVKIRKELNEFFALLEDFNSIYNNLGKLLKTTYDKTNFVLYESIMKLEDLQNINQLFLEKIFETLKQIFHKLKENTRFTNSINYFIKDFIFIYFSLKKFKNDEKLINSTLQEIKTEFLERFNQSISENFSRAYILIKNSESNADSNGIFIKGSIVNANIIQHLVDYIKKLSQSFMDLYENFSFFNNDETFYSSKDKLIYELNSAFTSSIMDNYFRNIFDKLTFVLNQLVNSSNEKNEKLLIQKFYFFYYILYKMNNVLILLLKSDFAYLISDGLIYTIKLKMNFFLSEFFRIIIQRIPINKYINDEINYSLLSKDISDNCLLFFQNENYDYNRAYEIPITNIIIYFLSLGSICLINKTEKDLNNYQILFSNLISIPSIFNKLNNNFITKFYDFIKIICQIDSIDKLNEIKNENNITKIKRIIINFRIYCLLNNDEKKEKFNNVIQILNNNKITNDGLIRLVTIIILHFFKIDNSCEILNTGDIKFEKQLNLINELKEAYS